ncbi:MAG: FAD-binding oxidoreductase [Nitrolancea sp.]
MATTPVIRDAALLDDAALQAFRDQLRGPLLLPEDPDYDAARIVWNAMIDHHPALIARARGAADVMATVNFARDHDLVLSIKGGGHSVSGKAVAEGGLMLDLSLMKGIRVDPNRRTVRAESGVLWQELDRETHAFGLATPGGVVGTTGIAGLSLGGGQSWIVSKYGFTIDNLLSIDIVTADGQLRHVNAEENPDLFWAIRGAGHNFGVATSFEYRLHAVHTVLGGMLLYPIDRAADVLRFYREFSVTQPDELTTYAALLTAPDGNLVAAIIPCYTGDLDEGMRVLAPIRAYGPPIVDTIAPIPHPVMQGLITAAYPEGRQNYWKSALSNRLSDKLIDTLIDHAGEMPSPYSVIVIIDCHGAYRRVGKTETAYYHRDKQYDVVLTANWEDPAENERNIGWTRACFDAIKPELEEGAYVNDLGDDEANPAARAYGGNYPRLVELKTKYDPTNLFRMNQNIKPAAQ